ncbi:ATP12 protein [Sodiomyces alkalinus F11]|uniref:ATP12 protein n=1 Tax=Sodiomyces alkalinus (strain CBS 110278 / VKM F-3762 / F11) TaxID=1314773 RepID=A0A3N2PJG1_SODAK|nr:ATP12 protein [Sodiomyces alkalinus F11]ROT34663.1 ATP12 protein [Sodiomyces alkalinus F11]
MKPPTRINLAFPIPITPRTTRPVAIAALAFPHRVAAAPQIPTNIRLISSTAVFKHADVAPIVGTGPPPEPPRPSAEFAKHAGPRNADDVAARIARRRKQAEVLKAAKEVKTSAGVKNGGAKRRFWKHVSVQEVDGTLQIHLDSRSLRHPTTKEIIRLPSSKPHLATALALEWDNIASTQQATKQHLTPLTSLVCRAIDIAQDDDAEGLIRPQIVTTVMRYLDTDSLLCWAPPALETDHRNDAGESLREVQERTAADIVSYLTTHVWPGLRFHSVLDEGSIMPRHQEDGVRDVVQGWVATLHPWELAGLERAALAGKSLLAATRLVVEWSEHAPAGGLRPATPAQDRQSTDNAVFGVEEAARATSVEVAWQTDRWGEVEDTHDVEKEDLRRQLGSAVLLVSGMGRR